ncbi:voltage-gated potassium channel subunit beta-1 [Grus japonensis]|uniref:Voltage-gated potassium channel subunit beta-1 n=1 Tax=Grus japonensis TaxID=30415 RepID=A0ABC9X7X5_GRUJA
MLAARTGTVGNKNAEEALKLRKQSVLSLGSRDRALKNSSESGKEGRARASQPQQRARRLALLRELEMNWYLRVCELSHEYTIAYTTGMPHRIVLLKVVYKEWPAGSPLQGVAFFSSDCKGKRHRRSRCSKEPGTVTAGRRRHLQIIRDELTVKLTLTRVFFFYLSRLRSRLIREEEAHAGDKNSAVTG